MANGKTPNIKALRFAHELDAAWIITIWKWLHGYEETYSEQKIAVEAIAALSSTLAAHAPEAISESSFAELQTRFQEIGVEFHSEAKTEIAGKPSTEARKIRTVCVKVGGKTICTQIPFPPLWQVQPPPE